MMMTLEQLAKAVVERWPEAVVGDYSPPACPTVETLASLLAAVNFAAGHPEEGRYPRFNVTATTADASPDNLWRFDKERQLSVGELRRLIPATDPRKSAIHVEWDDRGNLCIAGVHDLGTSWHRARIGLEYRYNAPTGLLVEVERPNRLSVYQRQFLMATFSDGEGDSAPEFALHLFLHKSTNAGLEDLADRMRYPEHESPREYAEFEFLALWNSYAAIANSIALAGHGGALIIVPTRADADSGLLRCKYPMRSSMLANAFVEFLNARHEVGDQYYLRDRGDLVDNGLLAQLEWKLKTTFDQLVETLRVVARFGECDGAIVLTRSLEVLGFGCEIVAQLRDDCAISEVTHELRREYTDLDVEQFGMRHRSALKLASQVSDVVILVVSQDGPISAVWNEEERVYMRKGVRLVNANLPWA